MTSIDELTECTLAHMNRLYYHALLEETEELRRLPPDFFSKDNRVDRIVSRGGKRYVLTKTGSLVPLVLKFLTRMP